MVSGLATYGQHNEKLTNKAEKKLKNWNNVFQQWNHLGDIKIDSISVINQTKMIELYFSKPLSYMPVRTVSAENLKTSLHAALKRKFKDYEIKIFTDNYEYDQLIPNYYRNQNDVVHDRIITIKSKPTFIKNSSDPTPSNGLMNNYIALWHSHGWYYESKLDRWEWQRARLFGTVEDISPMTYVLPYIVPMLENAGATVFLPRERDTQINEVIVDADGSSFQSEFILHADTSAILKQIGFASQDTLFPGDNPFQVGTSFLVRDQVKGPSATYLPDIPEKGNYAVYVSYQQSPENDSNVNYTIHHTGGSTTFTVNQTMGGGTWLYLGTFQFNQGKNSQSGAVQVSSDGQHSLDAIRFGGGMGHVARRPADEAIPNQWSLKNGSQNKVKGEKINPEAFTWKTSGRPRYMEAARYWLQYAGMPDTLVFNLNQEKNDYNDDYQSRGEWVGYLMGAPNGPTKDRNTKGLNIPIDLAFAFHTDAGVTPNDSIIGTLGIYSSVRENGRFPNGQSKLASRDLTDLIQTQVVEDIRALYNPKWTRRGMWNKQYSEAWRPNVPTMLLELLSHQNLADVRLGQDPRFRFDVSRAIYKGMLKFQAFQEGRHYVVQPLPVDHMAIQQIGENQFELSWMPVKDPLEPSAKPTQYRVYKRINDNGFDNGSIVNENSYQFTVDTVDQILSFKVAAINDGGESLTGEILSIGLTEESPATVLVVNAFDRVSGPAIIDNNGFAGIAGWEDQGVPDKMEIGYVGQQYDFDRKSPWLDDDSPGWGASYGNMEGKIIPGNSFDFTYTHGEAILKAGYSFISISDEMFNSRSYNTDKFQVVDIILGEEKTIPHHKDPSRLDFQIFTPPFMEKIQGLTEAGKHILMTGAYVGSDFMIQKDTIAEKFAREVLHYKWRTNHAVKSGQVYSTDYARPSFNANFSFNTAYHPSIYSVEAPDAIEPTGEGAITAWRYHENNSCAGILYNGKYKTVILGFPFETITSKEESHQLMQFILDFFNTKADNKSH
ncbi:MAG: hypothetical protein JEZ14_12855 [Marinilabiliaceae bacterium]|nr:hypothetical protein [Marinilabiliaceae bacterium]